MEWGDVQLLWVLGTMIVLAIAGIIGTAMIIILEYCLRREVKSKEDEDVDRLL